MKFYSWCDCAAWMKYTNEQFIPGVEKCERTNDLKLSVGYCEHEQQSVYYLFF